MKMKLLAAAAALAISGGAQAAVLFDNGSVTNSGNLSVITAPFTTLGAGSQITPNNVVADNFAAGAAWTVQSIDLFAYQTGATAFTFTNATWSIISGSINGGTVVASGTTAVTNAGLAGYRVSSTTLTDTSRPIYRINVDMTDFNLAAGNYYLTWTLGGTLASGPWTPTLPGSEGTGNAFQSLGGAAFAALADAGTGQSYDLPFRINGTAGATGAVPEPATWAMMIVGFGLVGGAMRRRTTKVAYA